MNMLSAGTPPAEPISTRTVCKLLNILEVETEREKERKREIFFTSQTQTNTDVMYMSAVVVIFHARTLRHISHCVSEP